MEKEESKKKRKESLGKRRERKALLSVQSSTTHWLRCYCWPLG
jgi:hypothetical protein